MPYPSRPPPQAVWHLEGHGDPFLPQREAAGRRIFSLWDAFCSQEGKPRPKERIGACRGPPGRPLPFQSCFCSANCGSLTANIAEMPGAPQSWAGMTESLERNPVVGAEPAPPMLHHGPCSGFREPGSLCPGPPRVDLFLPNLEVASVVPTSQMARPRPTGLCC